MKQIVQRYTADLLLSHFALSSQQHQLLMQCMEAALGQEAIIIKRHLLSHTLVLVHRVLRKARPRLEAVLDMAACHPQAIQMLQDNRHNPAVVNPTSQAELVEDILLLQILTDELSADQTNLTTDKGCRAWLHHYDIVAPAVSRVLVQVDMHMATDEWSEELVGTVDPSWLAYGHWCKSHISGIKCLWTKVSTVKLFIDYMSPLMGDKEGMTVEAINYCLLWNCLGADANLKTQKTLVSVDKYLKRTNKLMVKSLLGDVGSCDNCKTKLEGLPAGLPCGHRICNKCLNYEVKVNHKCPECQAAVPANFQPQCGSVKRNAEERLLLFQNQTSTFLMAVISQLCFAGHQPPEKDAIKHIFSYLIRRVKGVATIQTQKLTLREDQMDPTPVLRSFILRLLLKHSEDDVSTHIELFLDDARQLIKQQNLAEQQRAVLTELSLLIVHCTENLEYENDISAAEAVHPDERFALQCSIIKDELSRIRHKFENSALELPTLLALGQLRHALCVSASLLYEHVVQPDDFKNIAPELKDLLIEVFAICSLMSSDLPKLFLVKQLCREFGLQCYTNIVQRTEKARCLQWIQLDNVKEVKEVPDRYLVCGPEYCSVRDEITQEVRDQRGQLISHLKEMNSSNEHKQYLVLLALHREVVISFLSAGINAQDRVTKNAMLLLQPKTIQIDETFAQRVINNSLGVDESALHVTSDQNLGDHSMVCLLIHLWIALRAQKHKHDLLTLLATVIDQPAQIVNSFLPTMPQDDVEEIVKALNIDNTKTLEDYNRKQETPKLWECRNGHRYAIGDCGNPNAKGLCPECKDVVGGLAYNEVAKGNELSQIQDLTKPGHMLGAVACRSREPLPERSMSPAVCSLVRFLLHAVLYISASQPGQAAAVARVIHVQPKQPKIGESDVLDFFWGHLQMDLQALQKVVGRSCDDVYLLLHHLCHQLMVQPSVHCWNALLVTKNDRHQWESQFSKTYIVPLLQKTEEIIKTGNNLLLQDTRQGQNQLLNLVFEVGDQDGGDCELQHTAAVWKYRTRITVDHFFRQFQLHIQSQKAKLVDLPVLSLFHKESHNLRALYYLPDILALQRNLLQQLHHRLGRTEASQTSVGDMLSEKENPDLSQLVTVFSKAWDLVKDNLSSYRCRTRDGKLLHLPVEFHTVGVSVTSPVGVLLPDTEGPGRCAYLLIHYLLVRHNDFLERYCPHTRHSYDSLPEVDAHLVTRRHLVGYSPQSDLLPLMLAHCNYSLHLGDNSDGSSSTKLEYDFQGFELQLKNTLLLGKSRVRRYNNGSMEVETMRFCADTTNSKLVNSLREKLKQERLELHIQHQITSELRDSLPDICQSIDSLNTTLTILLPLKIEPDESLHMFMTQTLRMSESCLHSRKAQHYCCMKHVQSLWLLLCFLKARILATQNQETFDDQGPELRVELSEDQKTELETWLRRQSPDRRQFVATQLHHCIMLQLIGHSDDEDYVRPDKYDIRWLLLNSIENPLYAVAPDDSLLDHMTQDDLNTFPQSIMASQAITTWLQLTRHLETR